MAEVESEQFWQTSQTLSRAHLSIFPATLTDLTWHAYIGPTCSFSELPDSITALDFAYKENLRTMTHSNFMSLPSDLVSLKGVQFDPRYLGLLPRGLKYGSVRFNPHYINVNFGLSLDHLTDLPPTLETLACFIMLGSSIGGITSRVWAPLMPPNLTHLELAMPTLNPSDIELLPQTITRLKASTDTYLPILDKEREKPNRFWPASLTAFEFVSSKSIISPTAIIAFPRTLLELRSVTVAGVVNDIHRVLADLPPALRIFSMSMSLKPDIEIRTPLPAPLTSLSFQDFSIAPSSLPMLPSGLTALSIPNTVFNAGDIEAFPLPTSLKELHIENLAESSFHSLPPTITLLEMASGPTELNNKTHIKKIAKRS